MKVAYFDSAGDLQRFVVAQNIPQTNIQSIVFDSASGKYVLFYYP